MSYSGWKINTPDREMLLKAFVPNHPDIIAHHVTLSLGNSMPEPAEIKIVGYCNADDVECLVVEVNGSTIRPDGRVYHITLSINRAAGKKPADSNHVIRDYGWEDIGPISINTIPFYVDNTGKEFF